MTDTEIVCGFMEPKPKKAPYHLGPWFSRRKWWVKTQGGGTWRNIFGWRPRELTLDALREVEARLTEGQRQHYMQHVASLEGLVGKFYEDAWVFLHATAEQKIAALANVLRGAKR